jgi:hypothetical protein
VGEIEIPYNWKGLSPDELWASMDWDMGEIAPDVGKPIVEWDPTQLPAAPGQTVQAEWGETETSPFAGVQTVPVEPELSSMSPPPPQEMGVIPQLLEQPFIPDQIIKVAPFLSGDMPTVEAPVTPQMAAPQGSQQVTNNRTTELHYTGAPQDYASLRGVLTMMEMRSG